MVQCFPSEVPLTIMKVLHITTRIDTGGISTLLYNYYEQLRSQNIRFDVVAIATSYTQGYHKAFTKLGFGVYYMPADLFHRLGYLFSRIKNGAYDNNTRIRQKQRHLPGFIGIWFTVK